MENQKEFKNKVKMILKEAGVCKSTKIVNEIVSSFDDFCGGCAMNKLAEDTEDTVSNNENSGIHRRSKDYIFKVKSKKKGSRGTVTSTDIPDTDNIPTLDLSKDVAKEKKGKK